MKVLRNAEDLAEDFNAFLKPFLDGFRAVRMRFSGRYVENAHTNDLANLDSAWYSQFFPVPMCTISQG